MKTIESQTAKKKVGRNPFQKVSPVKKVAEIKKTKTRLKTKAGNGLAGDPSRDPHAPSSENAEQRTAAAEAAASTRPAAAEKQKSEPRPKKAKSVIPPSIDVPQMSKPALLLEKILVDIPATVLVIGIEALGLAKAFYDDYWKKGRQPKS